MNGFVYIGLAGLILLLLPVVILPWEGRRVPNACFVAIAVGGLLMAGLAGGAGAMLRAGGAGLTCFAVVSGIVIAICKLLNLQVFTSSHIKLLSVGGVWLGFEGALAMICIAFVALFGAAAFQYRRSGAGRPDFSVIAALAILCVSIQQTIPEQSPMPVRTVVSSK